MDEKKTKPVVEQAAAPQVVTQYVVSEKSLNGIGGWLIFWMIIFIIAGISYISTFFGLLVSADSSALRVISLIFAPLLAIGYIGSVVLIALEKRRAKIISIATISLSALYAVLLMIVGYASSTTREYVYGYGVRETGPNPSTLPMIVAAILIALVVHGLFVLYFSQSKRVKQTLVK